MLTRETRSLITEKLCAEFNDSLQGIILYGSHATGHATESSDYDLGILLDGIAPEVKLWEVAQALASTLKQDVDLVDLRAATTVLQKEVIATGIWLYQANSVACDLFEVQVLSMYQQLQEDRYDIVNDLVNGLKHG